MEKQAKAVRKKAKVSTQTVQKKKVRARTARALRSFFDLPLEPPLAGS